jgi:hypothetical protein
MAALATVGAGVATGGYGLNTPSGGSGSHVRIPASLKLPHEGEAGWHSDDNPDTPAAFVGCAGGDPTVTDRTAARTATGPGHPEEQQLSPTQVTEQLFLYDSDQAAKSAMAGLIGGLQACGWADSPTDLEGSHVTGQYPNAKLDRVTGIRAGNAVFLIYTVTRGDLMSSVGSDEESLIAARLCTVLKLCDPSPWVSPLPGGSPGPIYADPSIQVSSPGGSLQPGRPTAVPTHPSDAPSLPSLVSPAPSS